MIPILTPPATYWECPNCDVKSVTSESRPHTQFHGCAGLNGITAPLVTEGTKCKVEAKEREDYIGDQTVQRDDNNRPIMSVVTTREEGQDCAVMAPCAGIRGEVT